MLNIDKLIKYENGELSHEEMIALFQSLIDSGDVWLLQGSYGRTAQALIDNGECRTVEAHTAEAAE